MIKIVWLAPYNVSTLQPQLELNREVVQHSASWIHSLSEQLALNDDIELHIITHSQLINQSQTIKKNGIYFHVIQYSFPFTKRGFPWYLPFDKLTGYYSFKRKARKIINEIQPHILHVHGTEGGYFTPTTKTNIPCIISIQGIINEFVKVVPDISSYLQIPFENHAIMKGKYFGCRTIFDSNYVKKKNSNAIIFDLPEAMNEVFFQRQWKAHEGLTLIFVGSVNKRKGIVDLIHAVGKLKNSFSSIKLKIIGSGTKIYIRYLNKIIVNYNLNSNILWLGSKSPKEVAAELITSNIFVLPTLMDNSPNSLAEAMAIGMPCIATKVGGIPSMIEDRHDGMLFEKHDIDGLVNIIQLLTNDIELQDKLSQNARAKAFERNYPPNVVKKYVEVYKSLIK